MILLIGKKRSSIKNVRFNRENGFTFIEVMVTLVIFSVGIVMIFKSFLISLDRMNYLTNRLYATTLLDNRIERIDRFLKVYGALPFDEQQVREVDVGGKKVGFKEYVSIGEIEDFVEVFKLDLKLSWKENNKELNISRSKYISEFRDLDNK
ncbi:MAG: type II secretion system protein [Candidatus Zapsychrus exili]|nr:type II secretion system protein [Candidatus Zapsychrus exili]